MGGHAWARHASLQHTAPHAILHAIDGGVTPQGEQEDIKQLEAAFYQRYLEAAAGRVVPTVRRCYGGPAPLGVGLGILQVRLTCADKRGMSHTA